MNRRVLAAAVLTVWIAVLLVLWQRQRAVSPTQRLATGAGQLDPVTYFYSVFQGGERVGVASSAIDTSSGGMRVIDALRGRAFVYGDSQSVVLTSAAYLTRGFALDSFSVSLGGDQPPIHLTGVPRARAGVLLPTLVPIALMLGGSVQIGRRVSYWIYNPVSQRVERSTLTIAAESLFTVVDSARFDSTAGTWVPAHRDTIRAWSVKPVTGSLSAWVDSEGRIVAAREPGGLSLERTAYEIAALNFRRQPQ